MRNEIISRSIAKLEHSSRIDRESSRVLARDRAYGRSARTASKRDDEGEGRENFQFCSTAGLPSGNFETNWLSRESLRLRKQMSVDFVARPVESRSTLVEDRSKGEEREDERGWRISGSCSFHAPPTPYGFYNDSK